MKIEIKGNYLVIEKTVNGLLKTFEYPQGNSVYFTRYNDTGLKFIEILNTIHNGKTYVAVSDLNAGIIVDENNVAYTLTTLTELLQQYTGTFVGTNIKEIS